VADDLPGVTVLIPTKPDLTEIKAVTAARALDYPADKLEILVARGKQPSVQRNTGMRAARGELIYFLDDDSQARPGDLRRAVQHFRDPKVKIVGGPNLCPPDAPEKEQVFALVLSSWAFASSRARYASYGAVRESSEKELILCNMMARRDAMLELEGFNEALYPNEENALMDELQKRGGKLIYDPQLIVYRRPRSTLRAFCKMLMTYGRGRAEQFRETPTMGSAPNFVPPIFLIYLLTLPLWFWAVGLLSLVPLALYALVVLLFTIEPIPRGGIVRSLLAAPLILLTHVLYGFGFWRGLFTKLKPPGARSDVPVKLERM
jgi:succinoglycan biosynthesis protein ExoA